MTREEPIRGHPTDQELAAYLGKKLRGETLEALESHLAQCPVCREEVMDAREILGSERRRPKRILVPLTAAAAALVLFFSWSGGDGNLPVDPVHREAPNEVGSAPTLHSPRGLTLEARSFVWGRPPGADQYRLTLFDADGSVLWRETTSDSVASLPDSLTLTGGRSYLWQVEARVGWDLWESSDLIEFRLEEGNDISSSTGLER